MSTSVAGGGHQQATQLMEKLRERKLLATLARIVDYDRDREL